MCLNSQAAVQASFVKFCQLSAGRVPKRRVFSYEGAIPFFIVKKMWLF